MPSYRRNIYILSITIFLASVSWNQIVPFLPLFLQELGTEEDRLLLWSGIVFAAQSAAAIIAFPFWGKLGDRHGRKPMVLRAGICLTGIYYGMSFCTTPWQLALFRFLNGALTGFIPGSFALIATNSPQEKAPRAVATAQTAAAAGTVIGPALGGLLAAVFGYRGAMRISGTAVLISTILVAWLVKEINKSRSQDKTSLLQDLAASVRSPVLSSIMVAVMLQGVFITALAPILALHLERLGGNGADWVIGVVFALPAVAFMLTARLWTRSGERWGFHRMILFGMIGTAIGTFSLVTAQSVLTFGILFFGAGIWLAAITPSAGAIVCVRVEETFRGRAYGMQMSAMMLGGLFAPIVATQIGAACGMSAIFISLAVLFLVGAFIFRLLAQKWVDDLPVTESPAVKE